MLHEFLTRNHDALIARCRQKVAGRPGRRQEDPEMQYGIPVFLDQLITRLREDGMVAVPVPPDVSDIGRTAARHGDELLRTGFTVDQVVHDYGDLCQAVTEMAVEQNAAVSAHDFRLLNGYLDEAIADAITEFGRQRDRVAAAENTDASNERLASFAHELRNLIGNAILAVAVIKKGSAGLGGSTGALLDRSLISLRDLVDRALTEARLARPLLARRIIVADLVADVQVATMLEVVARDLEFVVASIDSKLAVEGDRQLLAGAVRNLLQNAVKFTRPHGRIDLAISTAGDRVLIEVADECGGLPAGTEDVIFRPFEQLGPPATGLGLGLGISRRSVEAHGGRLTVRSLPGKGCVFTIDLSAAVGGAAS